MLLLHSPFSVPHSASFLHTRPASEHHPLTRSCRSRSCGHGCTASAGQGSLHPGECDGLWIVSASQALRDLFPLALRSVLSNGGPQTIALRAPGPHTSTPDTASSERVARAAAPGTNAHIHLGLLVLPRRSYHRRRHPPTSTTLTGPVLPSRRAQLCPGATEAGCPESVH